MGHGARVHNHDPSAHDGFRYAELLRLEGQLDHGRGTDRPEPSQVQRVPPAQLQSSFEQEQHGGRRSRGTASASPITAHPSTSHAVQGRVAPSSTNIGRTATG
jgi:hypothetical protein